MSDRMNLRRRSQIKPPDRYAEGTNTIKETEDTKQKPRKRNDKKKIALSYGTTTPPTNVNTRPLYILADLPEEVENEIKNGATTFSLKNGKILPEQDHNYHTSKSQWIYFITLFIFAVLIFLAMLTDVFQTDNQGNSLTFLKTFKPSSELIVLPKKYLKRKESVPAKLKTNELEKQNLKRNLFIEQECNNLDKNNFQYNYALKSNGARILSTMDTEPYGENYIKIKFLGVNLGPLPNFIFPQHSYDSSGPSALLEGPIIPGQCWAFKGSRGRARILLAKSILIKAIEVEQLPGNFNSAPRFFSIMGIDFTDNQQEIRTHLGTFEFEKNGGPKQYFMLTSDEAKFPFRIIEFHVTANHGNKDFTCVYRLRVYGDV